MVYVLVVVTGATVEMLTVQGHAGTVSVAEWKAEKGEAYAG